ncbi:nodulation S family protein [Streptomyces sp. NBC_00841]|nr:nodulation S family protein [Streptomyces sp. NBC_01669]WSA04671.1 nodulation S family protein [Streptomyces sp. NBC_00841]
MKERWYEQRKYALTLASLPRPKLRSAFEPACSVDELSRLLAPRCERLLVVDRVASAVDTARRHTADLGQVEVARLVVPEEWPEERFDLVVLSELLYCFDETRLNDLLSRTTASLERRRDPGHGALEPPGARASVHGRAVGGAARS